MFDLGQSALEKLSQAHGSAEGLSALLIELKTAWPSESDQSEPYS
jgi:hypothetical protein